LNSFNAAGAGLALLLVALLPHGVAAQAQEATAQWSESDWTATILEEDDFWAPHNRDRHYTHGIRFSATSGEAEGVWQRPFIWLSGLTAAFPNTDDASRRYNVILLGQNMYTPENFRLFNPDPHDRPFAGWLYSAWA
jgi:lipid A 3-O-deacylase